MAYTKKTWQNLPDLSTPLNAPGMNDLETRIDNGIQLADALSIPSDTNNIASNSDLNDFTTEGGYKCQSAAIAATLSNTPYTAGAFKLIVIKYHDASRYGQFLLGLATPIIYFRTFSSNGWSSWRVFNNNYSTSEQVVGTWINNKPLYRKIIIMNAPNVSTSGTYASTESAVIANNIDNCFIEWAYLADNTGQKIPLNYVTNDNLIIKTLVTNDKKIRVLSNTTGYNGNGVTISVLYTKTTD